MSKKAMKALANAEGFMNAAGVTVSLVEFFNTGKERKTWRNGEKLASLIINSAANAFQTETPETLKENGYDTMADAVEGYIAANLDSWTQAEWEYTAATDVAEQLDRLAEMINRHNAYMSEGSRRDAIADRAFLAFWRVSEHDDLPTAWAYWIVMKNEARRVNDSVSSVAAWAGKAVMLYVCPFCEAGAVSGFTSDEKMAQIRDGVAALRKHHPHVSKAGRDEGVSYRCDLCREQYQGTRCRIKFTREDLSHADH